MKKLVLLFVCASVIAACGKQEEESDLSISFGSDKAKLIADGASSCASRKQAATNQSTPEKDVSKASFSLSRPVISWKGSESLAVISIEVTMDSPKIKNPVTCYLAEEEMMWLFADDLTTAWTGLIPAGGSVDANPNCLSIRCGGVEQVNDNAGFSGTATVKVLGTRIDAQGEAIESVTARATVTVEK